MVALTLRGDGESDSINTTMMNNNGTMMAASKEMINNNNGGVMMDVNAEHNFIGLCVLLLFVVIITIADFVIQDVSFSFVSLVISTWLFK